MFGPQVVVGASGCQVAVDGESAECVGQDVIEMRSGGGFGAAREHAGSALGFDQSSQGSAGPTASDGGGDRIAVLGGDYAPL